MGAAAEAQGGRSSLEGISYQDSPIFCIKLCLCMSLYQACDPQVLKPPCLPFLGCLGRSRSRNEPWRVGRNIGGRWWTRENSAEAELTVGGEGGESHTLYPQSPETLGEADGGALWHMVKWFEPFSFHC